MIRVFQTSDSVWNESLQSGSPRSHPHLARCVRVFWNPDTESMSTKLWGKRLYTKTDPHNDRKKIACPPTHSSSGQESCLECQCALGANGSSATTPGWHLFKILLCKNPKIPTPLLSFENAKLWKFYYLLHSFPFQHISSQVNIYGLSHFKLHKKLCTFPLGVNT